MEDIRNPQRLGYLPVIRRRHGRPLNLLFDRYNQVFIGLTS